MEKKILFLLIPVYFILTGFFSLYQSGNIKNDGSGSLNIVYSGTIKEIEDQGYALGNFPFGEKNVRDFFSSDDVIIKKLQIARPEDTAYMVILDLDFKNVNDLNKLRGFSDMNIKLTKVDGGTDFEWTINSNDRTKLLKVLNCSLTFESEIVSTNGVNKDNSVKWFKTDFNQENFLSVILKANLPVTADTNEIKEKKVKESTEPQKVVENTEPQKEEVNKKKCSVFGMELPLILLTGLIYFYRNKRKQPKS